MTSTAVALLSAQLRAYGGRVVPSRANGHNVYGPSGTMLASVHGSDAGPDGTEHARQQLLDVLRVAVQTERAQSDRYIVKPSRMPYGGESTEWITIRDTNLGRDVAQCYWTDAPAIIAGLLDHQITHGEG